MKEISFVMIKPGFTAHEEAIVERLNKVGTIVKRQKMILNDAILQDHYHEHVGKDFYPEVANYMKSGEVIGFMVEGEEGLVARIRQIVGATKNPEAGTIRADFGIGEITRNVIHASDSPATGKEECERMFNNASKYNITILD